MENQNHDLIDAIKEQRWERLAGITPRERALCDIAHKLSATPTRIVAEDWRPLRDLGFGDRECLEVAHIVGLFNYLTRLADGLGLQLDPKVEAAGRTRTPLERPD